MQPNIENFIGCDSSYRAASIVLYGAPYDSTTSYRPGARFGPAAIRHESYGLETYSPYQNADLTDFDIFDSGDLELCFGSSESALADIEARAEEILQDGKFPLLLGGEHLVTLGAVRAAVKKYPDLHIVHFDAHADLRDDYLGAKLSHACVLRRCWELAGDGRIHQFGIRSGDREEFAWGSRHVDTHKFDFEGLEALMETLFDEMTHHIHAYDTRIITDNPYYQKVKPQAGQAGAITLAPRDTIPYEFFQSYHQTYDRDDPFFYAELGFFTDRIEFPVLLENGNVWMSHQFFMWKTMFDLGETEFAFEIARRALDMWREETDFSYNTYECFGIQPRRGGWFHNFGGLSAPINVWADCYYRPGTFTCGLDVWTDSQKLTDTSAEVHFRYTGDNGQYAFVLTLSDAHSYRLTLDGQELDYALRSDGCMEITLPGTVRSGVLKAEIK